MKIFLILFVTLPLLQTAPCFQTCIVDFLKRLLAPRKPVEHPTPEYKLPLLERLKDIPGSALNERGRLNDVAIIKKGVDILMEGTEKPEEKTTTVTAQKADDKIRNNITIITRSEVDVITEGEDAEAKLNEDLLESFGGGTDDKNDFEEAESPKNGMYFMVDWNTFLEVDDQNGNRVNLRVQPKLGDPKQFLDVRVP